MSLPETNHDILPKEPVWTHLALRVANMDATIAWYEKFTHLKVITRGEDVHGYNAWLGAPASNADSPFMLVIAEFFDGKDPFAPAEHAALGPFAHIGIELPSMEAVDDIAERGKGAGCLAFGPKMMAKQVGYVCFLKDPDGNTVEFSFDQGIYEKAKEVWS